MKQAQRDGLGTQHAEFWGKRIREGEFMCVWDNNDFKLFVTETGLDKADRNGTGDRLLWAR